MKKFTLLFFTVLAFMTVKANNIQVSNVSLTGQNTGSDFVFVEFDLSWENSWRINVGPSNWDAAWVFIKYRVNGGDWHHARLNYSNGTSDGHVVPSGVAIRTVNDGLSYGLGSFIYRSANGSGNNDWQNIRLRWNYGLNGVGDNDLVDVQVFALEMVYVPQGSFSLGGGTGTEAGKLFAFPNTQTSYQVNSENAINVGASAGSIYYLTGLGTPGDQLGPIPAAFPKGYGGFYCMKYEMSQDQWVSFFNTLTDAQKVNHDVTDALHKNSDITLGGNTIAWSGTGSATTSTPTRAMNYVNWSDCNAYLDWAALRPLTELEYEKACRGPLATVANEYAWGNSSIYTGGAFTVTNPGTENETITNMPTGVGISINNSTAFGLGGPLRCGIIAASAVNKTREESGGTYYGIMEMCGNVYERLVSIGSAEGRGFNGLNGNGELNGAGSADVANWVNTGSYRGAGYPNPPDRMRVNDRWDGQNVSALANSRVGATRGARSMN